MSLNLACPGGVVVFLRAPLLREERELDEREVEVDILESEETTK